MKKDEVGALLVGSVIAAAGVMQVGFGLAIAFGCRITISKEG